MVVRESAVFLANLETLFVIILRDYEVYFSVQGVLDHAFESFAVLRVGVRYPFVRVDLHELPVRTRLYVIGVVVDLRLIGCELVVVVGRHPRMARNPSSDGGGSALSRYKRTGCMDYPNCPVLHFFFPPFALCDTALASPSAPSCIPPSSSPCDP